MTPENFVFWLQGFLEIAKPETITSQQIQIINDHMRLVLQKITPNREVSPMWSNGNVIYPIPPAKTFFIKYQFF
jgi:hypothetical protein